MAHKAHTQLKGFTLTEVMVTLVLTSIALTLAYGTLGYIQKLFSDYKTQNRFINQFAGLRQRLDLEALRCDAVIAESDNTFIFRSDTTASTLVLLEKKLLLKKGVQCDTFNFPVKNLKLVYEPMQNPLWQNRLVKSLQFETGFTKQRFNFYFYKNYDAGVKLALDTQN